MINAFQSVMPPAVRCVMMMLCVWNAMTDTPWMVMSAL